MKLSLISFCISLSALIFCSSIFAQSNLEDVVYLKNGGVMHGTIVEQMPGKSLKIETHDGNIFVYQMSEIEKFTREPIIHRENNLGADTVRTSGYAGYLLGGVNQSVSGLTGTLPSIHFVNGFRIGSATLGFGVGGEFIDGLTLIPVWIDSHSNFGDGSVRPGFFGHLGYTFASYSSDFLSEGLSYGAGLSLKFMTSPNLGLIFDLGYRVQTLIRGQYGAVQALFGIAF
jgi:hypothetical protein